MKNKKHIYTLLIGSALMLSSCEDLTYYNPGAVVQETFWQTEDDAKKGVIGVYNMMKNPWAFGYYFLLDQCSDLITSTTTGYGAAARGESASFASNNGSIQNHWTYLYEMIHRANSVIRNVGAMESISQTTKDQIVGEAKFLRAMAYFELINCWGDVPYYGEDFVVAESYLEATNPRESTSVIRQHILDDLNDAASKLPLKWDDANYGRATKGAAVALRGKVYLYNREWQNAINDFEDIVYNKTASYGYELAKDIEEWEFMFHMYPGRKSPEYIFSMMSENAPGTGSYGNALCSMLGSKATYLNIAGNPVVPSTRLIDKFENPDGTKFQWTDIFPNWESSYDYRKSLYLVKVITPDPDVPESSIIGDYLDSDSENVIRAYRERDPRLWATAIVPFSHTLGCRAMIPDDMTYVFPGPGSISLHAATTFFPNDQGWYSYLFRKFVPEGDCDGHISAYTDCPYEFPFIRLSDVVLMLAEAYNEVGQLDNAITEVNKIRSRVGMPVLNEAGKPWMAVGSKDDMTQRIRDERAFELVIEGHRFHDLKRWGIYDTAFENEHDIFEDQLYVRSYQARYELWPIPQVAIERNPNLTQNTGW